MTFAIVLWPVAHAPHPAISSPALDRWVDNLIRASKASKRKIARSAMEAKTGNQSTSPLG